MRKHWILRGALAVMEICANNTNVTVFRLNLWTLCLDIIAGKNSSICTLVGIGISEICSIFDTNIKGHLNIREMLERRKTTGTTLYLGRYLTQHTAHTSRDCQNSGKDLRETESFRKHIEIDLDKQRDYVADCHTLTLQSMLVLENIKKHSIKALHII